MTAKSYWTLITFNEQDEIWYPQFGDYDRSVVEDERDDYSESGGYHPSRLAIVRSGDSQESIGVAVLNFNRNHKVQRFMKLTGLNPTPAGKHIAVTYLLAGDWAVHAAVAEFKLDVELGGV